MFKTIAGAVIAGTLALMGSAALAQTPEKPSLKLGVGGKPLLYYLPLTLAERLGYFKEQGLTVEIEDFGGGAKSLQALVGGSVDVVTGAYEHTIRMQTKGQDIRAVIELGRYPGIVIGIRAGVADKYKGPADLKGMKIGVTAPGSSTNMLVNFVLAKAGQNPTDASFIGLGSPGAVVAAMQRGEIDAISHLDPAITMLEATGAIKTVIDTRTQAGTEEVFGGSNPAAVLYIKQDFIEKNPNTVQALVNVFYRTLKWLEKATPEQVADTVPQEYLLGDKKLYMAAVAKVKASYSVTGVIPDAGMKSAFDMLVRFDDEVKTAKPEILAKTWDGRFVKKAAETVK
jgi:NitT/TauT family transport system substrate-binding protein